MRFRRLTSVLASVVLGGVVGAPATALASHTGSGGPALVVDTATVEAAMTCPESFDATDDLEPVLLVHGTFTNSDENWGWNYIPALPALGYDVCWVDLPARSLEDIQIASEYVVHAIRVMHAASGERIDVLGHSQGGLEPRWAVKWWPDVRAAVDDLVTLASPHHGTVVADGACATGCNPAVHQMRTTSTFIAELNAEDETPGGISYTSLYSATDQLVQPVAPDPTSALDGASNILLQDLCPGRPVDHISIAADAVAHWAVIDAFTQAGPADVSRFDPATCAEGTFDGVSPDGLLTAENGERFLSDALAGPSSNFTTEEPAAAPYTSEAPAPDATPAPADSPAPAPTDEASAGAQSLPTTGGGAPAAGALLVVAAALLGLARGPRPQA